MKRKIKFIDKVTAKGKSTEGGVVTEITQTIRDLDHFHAQQKYKAKVFDDRRKRKPKYKPDYSLGE